MRAIPRGPLPQTEQELAWRKQMIARDMQDTPMKRMGKPEELAAAVAFVASDEASYMTGEIVDVSGGCTGRI